MRELAGVVQRLSWVHVVRFLLAVTFLLSIAPLSALSQSGVGLSASAGLDGWVNPDGPFQLEITASSEVLIDGRIEVSLNNTVVSIPAQIPAGTTKVFTVTMPPPTSGGNIRIVLLDSGNSSVAVEQINPRYPTQEVLLGVVGNLDAAMFDRLRTPIVDRPIVAIPVRQDDDLSILDYLVSEGFGAEAESFIGPGRLVVTETAPDDAILIEVSGEIDRFELSGGQVLVVPDVADLPAYTDHFRAKALRSGVRDIWQSPDQQLAEAASNSGDGGVPELPWLLAAILAYAVLVGPINFLVLHRMARRDLAWLTIPAISIVALFMFWLVGGQRLENATLNHSALIVGGEVPMERSSVVLAVGSEGSFELDFAGADVAYPWSVGNRFDEFGRPVATTASQVTGSTVTFDLQQLGFAAAAAIGPSRADLPEVTSSISDAVTTLEVNNNTDIQYWAWGVYTDGAVRVGDSSLEPGVSSSLSSRQGGVGGGFRGPEWGWTLGDAVINQLELWGDDRGWRILSPSTLR